MDNNRIMEYRVLDQNLAKCDDWLNGGGESETELFIPTIDERDAAERLLSVLTKELEGLPVTNSISVLLKSHFEDFLDALKSDLTTRYEKPSESIRGFQWLFERSLKQDCRSDDVKAKRMIKKLSHTAEMFKAIESWLDSVNPLSLLEAKEACQVNISAFARFSKEIKDDMPDLSDSTILKLQSAFKDFSDQNEAMQDVLEQRLKAKALPDQTTDDSILRLEPEVYADHLLSTHGVLLEELLNWHEEEIEKTRDNVFSIASKLKVPEASREMSMANVNDILLKYAGPADSPEEMLRLGNEYIKRTGAACRDYVWLPEEECTVVKISESIKDSYPWGGYGGGCPLRRPLKGEMFLNNYNFKAVTNGWIKMNTVHEAYPGHHVQFVRNIVDPIPETLKRGSRYTPIFEGTPHRSEELFEFVFPEDPFYPLFVAYRRHHTAVRIKADLMLRYYGNPIKEVVQLYCDELDFDRVTARGQVRAQEYMLGYFTCYYYGYKMLTQWEHEYGFDKKEYTELLFSAARMSMSNFKRFLDLSEADRQSFLKDFASLNQFNEDYSEKPIKLD